MLLFYARGRKGACVAIDRHPALLRRGEHHRQGLRGGHDFERVHGLRQDPSQIAREGRDPAGQGRVGGRRSRRDHVQVRAQNPASSADAHGQERQVRLLQGNQVHAQNGTCASMQKPYFVVQCGSQSMVTEPQEEGNSKLLQWSETLRVKVQ